MVRYLYQALDTSHYEIRLIRLLPGFFYEDINIQIFHEPLSKSQRPKYEALSYVWGSSDNTRSITVRAATSPLDKNGKPWSRIVRRLGLSSSKSESHKTKTADYALRPRLEGLGQLHVTLNLLIALKHLRRDHVPRILWVDAICINQEDLRERSSEVGRMGWIYSKADSVIAWLGSSSDNSALALPLFDHWGKIFLRIQNEILPQSQKAARHISYKRTPKRSKQKNQNGGRYKTCYIGNGSLDCEFFRRLP